MTLLPEPRVLRSFHGERQTGYAKAKAARLEETFTVNHPAGYTQFADAATEAFTAMSETMTRVAGVFDKFSLELYRMQRGKAARVAKKQTRIRIRKAARLQLQRSQASWSRR